MVIKLTILEALEPFLSKPFEKLHLAEISRMLKEPHPTVRQWLNLLEKKGILKKQFQGRLTLYSLQLENQNIVDYLAIAEKNKLVRNCEKFLVLKELVYYINSNLKEEVKALIFGSAAEAFNKAEDIDLLIIGKMENNKFRAFSDRFNKELHTINLSSITKVSKSLKEEIIKKHLLLNGTEDFIRWMIWHH
jgi:DNA-binding transcriptional ArsR family regulator